MIQMTVEAEEHVRTFSKDAELLGTYAGMDSSIWRLGLLKTPEEPVFASELETLNREAGFPNVFLSPAYLKAAVHHLECSDVRFLFLSKQCGKNEELVFFLPVRPAKIGFSRQPVWRSWTHDYANLGMPLVSSKNTDETIKAFGECLNSIKAEKAKAIVIDYLPIKGEFIEGLYASKTLSDRILLTNPVKRAGLKSFKDENYSSVHLSGKRRQRLSRAKRELEAMGDLRFEKISDPHDINRAVKEFMELEASGWKGKRKTALQLDAQTRKFCAEAACMMAVDRKFQVYTAKLNDKLIAAMIVFVDKGHAFTWKTAYDETYAKQSVGNLLTVYATSELSKNENFRHLDSLAAHFNQNALDFWPDQTEIVSMIIGIGENYSANTLKVTNAARRFQYLKNKAREILKP